MMGGQGVLPSPSLLLRLNIRPDPLSEIVSEEDSEDFVTDLSSGFRVNIKENNRKEAEISRRFFILILTVGVRQSSEDKLMLILSVQQGGREIQKYPISGDIEGVIWYLGTPWLLIMSQYKN